MSKSTRVDSLSLSKSLENSYYGNCMPTEWFMVDANFLPFFTSVQLALFPTGSCKTDSACTTLLLLEEPDRLNVVALSLLQHNAR
jgi:hypothetical protein